MREYSFVLKFRLSEGDRDLDELVERLGEAGCTDALVGLGTTGRLALDFTREAESAEEAVRSALTEVRSAVPEAILIEASPDLVGLTDVAELMGISRQGARKLMTGHEDFPLPVHEGSISLWHLAEVLAWLDSRGDRRIDAGLHEVAAVTCEVNLARDALRRPVGKFGDFNKLVA